MSAPRSKPTATPEPPDAGELAPHERGPRASASDADDDDGDPADDDDEGDDDDDGDDDVAGASLREDPPGRDAGDPGRTAALVPGSAAALADQLATALRDHVRRSLGVELEASPTSLAFVDHYLHGARTEQRPAIALLVAAEAGAWYGELVRREMGGQWIGDGQDPRSLRLLLRDQFLHFAPVDQALEVVLGPEADESRVPDGPDLDTAFHARPVELARTSDTATTDADDETWLAARLAELPPVGEDEYYSLTCRFETLQLVLELLAAKHVGEGRSPREYGLEDYTEVGVVAGKARRGTALD
jgi:hypothetical protein